MRDKYPTLQPWSPNAGGAALTPEILDSVTERMHISMTRSSQVVGEEIPEGTYVVSTNAQFTGKVGRVLGPDITGISSKVQFRHGVARKHNEWVRLATDVEILRERLTDGV